MAGKKVDREFHRIVGPGGTGGGGLVRVSTSPKCLELGLRSGSLPGLCHRLYQPRVILFANIAACETLLSSPFGVGWIFLWFFGNYTMTKWGFLFWNLLFTLNICLKKFSYFLFGRGKLS